MRWLRLSRDCAFWLMLKVIFCRITWWRSTTMSWSSCTQKLMRSLLIKSKTAQCQEAFSISNGAFSKRSKSWLKIACSASTSMPTLFGFASCGFGSNFWKVRIIVMARTGSLRRCQISTSTSNAATHCCHAFRLTKTFQTLSTKPNLLFRDTGNW